MEELCFDRQVVIVTGAGGALGAGYAKFLAERGALVVVNGRTSGTVDATVSDIIANGGTAVPDCNDVAVEADLIVRSALDAFGRLDVVINNAAVWNDAPLYGDRFDEFTKAMDINLNGTLNLTRAAWPELAKTGGRLVQTSSAAVFGVNHPSYGISKAGVFGSVYGLKSAAEAAGIKINGVLPIAYSEMLETTVPEGESKEALRRMLPSQLAAFVALLCHDAVPFNGMCFDAGGRHACRVLYAHNPGAYGDTPEDFLKMAGQLSATEVLIHSPDAHAFSAWKIAKLR
ncbi:3-oxoacyl-ACP reductase (plasmid) [Sphingobium sp. TKS]|nr:3-oxoacyl-ACP reductase [Sphingobium sp. TKS]